MSDVAIRAENLGKRYRIGREKEQYGTLRDTVMSAVQAPLRSIRRGAFGNEEEFWALRDVSFELKHGEVLGVIGRNGAGKSTLLKILSQITEPTTGRAKIHGRVGSLLEVGTGFHPELSGRENVYLNGAIIGMTKRDIAKRFDEIVEFAEIEQFLDTPVKRYSSGMYTRLAFSVAAHLEPEVLIVDEVLSVGDAAFQRKSLGKMGDVAREGRTVLFVSHNMPAVQVLCEAVMVIESGRIVEISPADQAIRRYYGSVAQSGEVAFPVSHSHDSAKAQYLRLRMLNSDGNVTGAFVMGSSIAIELEFRSPIPLRNPTFGVIICGALGDRIIRMNTRDMLVQVPQINVGGRVLLTIDETRLLPGTYSLTVGLSEGGVQHDLRENSIQFEIQPWVISELGGVPRSGIVYAPHRWDWDVY